LPFKTVNLKIRHFMGEVQDFARLLGAGWIGLRDAWHYRRQILDSMLVFGVAAAPLVMLSALFLGLVLALEWGTKLEPFGAKFLMGRIVSIGVVREIGPVITGLMVAGRTGAKLAAEIGSMKVTEQINALRAMGVEPIPRLVMPRQVASMLTMLPLTVLADAVAIAGGWYVAVTWLNTPSQVFWTQALDSLTFKDLAVGFIKPVFFGYIIASVSAYYGLATRGGASGVGKNATRAVMLSSLSVLIVDFILGKLILALFGS
jgi:phospholipid/cholesterol/gamma-HCH transport system permease protein